eukprot:scaffold41855_cov31-Tisochrysis_lutea.AAC.3
MAAPIARPSVHALRREVFAEPQPTLPSIKQMAAPRSTWTQPCPSSLTRRLWAKPSRGSTTRMAHASQ